ncbi:MAG: hypothetical protein ACTSWR_04310, partial [Candidatus Helarchaeota archaeon]
VMINKVDLPGGVTAKDVSEVLQKAKLTNAIIIEGVAINGENVRKAFDLCAKSILKNYLGRKSNAS